MADISELIIDVYNPHPIIPSIKPIALSAMIETTNPNHPKIQTIYRCQSINIPCVKSTVA